MVLSHLLRGFCCMGGVLIGVCTQARTEVRPLPTPLYPQKWGEVEQYIKSHWMDFVEESPAKRPPLPKPYSYALNPGTLYYYDLYFINYAMLRHGFAEQVRNNLDCFTHEVETIGLVANAWGWGEDRSQTPYFSMSVRDFWENAPQAYRDPKWLLKTYQALLKEYAFWTNTNGNTIEDHTTPIVGLQRYGEHADSATIMAFYRMLENRIRAPRNIADSLKYRAGAHRLAECESMDFTPRYDGRCMDFIPTDLNANLYEYEMNFAFFERELGLSNGKAWEKRAKTRAALINRYLWNEKRGVYLDYDYVNRRFTDISCIVTFRLLGCGAVPKSRRDRLVETLFRELEVESGLTTCCESGEPFSYQFGRNGIWGSMQFIAMMSLERGGYHEDARRIAMKYLNMVTKNYVNPVPDHYIPHGKSQMEKRPAGLLWEKFTHTGDINDLEYYCSPILGFTAAPYVLALEIIRQDTPHTQSNPNPTK